MNPGVSRSRSTGTAASYFIETSLYFRAYDFNCRCKLCLYFFLSFTGARSTTLSRKCQSSLLPCMLDPTIFGCLLNLFRFSSFYFIPQPRSFITNHQINDRVLHPAWTLGTLKDPLKDEGPSL